MHGNYFYVWKLYSGILIVLQTKIKYPILKEKEGKREPIFVMFN